MTIKNSYYQLNKCYCVYLVVSIIISTKFSASTGVWKNKNRLIINSRGY